MNIETVQNVILNGIEKEKTISQIIQVLEDSDIKQVYSLGLKVAEIIENNTSWGYSPYKSYCKYKTYDDIETACVAFLLGRKQDSYIDGSEIVYIIRHISKGKVIFYDSQKLNYSMFIFENKQGCLTERDDFMKIAEKYTFEDILYGRFQRDGNTYKHYIKMDQPKRRCVFGRGRARYY